MFLVCLLLAVSKGSAWGTTATLGLSVAAATVVPLWGWFELRTASPLVDLRVSVRPAVLFTNLSGLLIGFSFYANSLATPQLVQEPTWTGYGLGESIVVSGLCLLPSGLAMVLLSPVSAGIVIGATVVSVGTAVAYSALPALIMHAVPVTETAAANSLNALMRTIGAAICSTIVVTVLTHVTIGSGDQVAPALSAYLMIFVIAGAVAAGLVLLIPARRQAPVHLDSTVGTS